MTRKELEKAGFTVKDNGRVDFNVPPKGKIFVPLPTDKDDLENTGYDHSFVTWHRFSATSILVKMVLVDESELETVKIYIEGIKAEFKRRERDNRCQIVSPATGRWIMCPECNSCLKDNCPKKNGMEAVKHKTELLEENTIEKMKRAVNPFDPTASTAVVNVMWEGFKENLRNTDLTLFKILEMEEYGYDYKEILGMLKRGKKSASWYYYQWKRIGNRWRDYYFAENCK